MFHFDSTLYFIFKTDMGIHFMKGLKNQFLYL